MMGLIYFANTFTQHRSLIPVLVACRGIIGLPPRTANRWSSGKEDVTAGFTAPPAVPSFVLVGPPVVADAALTGGIGHERQAVVFARIPKPVCSGAEERPHVHPLPVLVQPVFGRGLLVRLIFGAPHLLHKVLEKIHGCRQMRCFAPGVSMDVQVHGSEPSTPELHLGPFGAVRIQDHVKPKGCKMSSRLFLHRPSVEA